MSGGYAEADRARLLTYLLTITTTQGTRALVEDFERRRREPVVRTLPLGERINNWPREVMNRKIRDELSHIPRGEMKSPQNFLRFCYSGMRRHDMAYTNKEKESTLRVTIHVVQKVFPNFIPKYDKGFFKLR